MNQQEKDFCFCTLALRPKYRALAKRVAQDLETNSPGTLLVVGTDDPKDFEGCSNVSTFSLYQRGILHCYHDKRFVIEKALTQARAAIIIDADTRIVEKIPNDMTWKPGLTACSENLIEHVKRYTPERLKALETVAEKLNISLEGVPWVGESLFIVARDGGKEIEFLNLWGKIGNYLELKGIHAGSGNAIGLAAAKVGWTVNGERWHELSATTKHLDASYEKKSRTFWQIWERRLGYHYRLNRSRLQALKEFDFYYR
ncbi:MAG: hypothetical protein LDL41_17475 [Coleofasciculus sp. S288]|nr:hypothetical protein [Coleofasciculus sp. S288]